MKITKEGLDNLKKELNHLRTEETRKIAELIKKTAAFGDLKENFAYHDAKDKQAFLQGKIREIDQKIKNAEVVEKNQGDKIQIGSKIKVEIDGEETEFSIVDSLEIDPLKGKISYESPIGRALLGKSEGEDACMEIGEEKTTYKILKVE